MSDERDHRNSLVGQGDILAEIEAEIAHDLEEERAPEGGPAYQVVGAVVALALGVAGAALAWSYGLGSLREPGPGLWPKPWISRKGWNCSCGRRSGRRRTRPPSGT